MPDDLRADLDELLAQGQRPRVCGLRHRQRAHEVADVIRRDMELVADRRMEARGSFERGLQQMQQQGVGSEKLTRPIVVILA